MHQTRNEVSMKLPIPRKGTKYVARALTNLKNSVPVIIAVRDMLKIARNTKEVQKMINQKLLKINGKDVKDVKDSICLFNIFEADKIYTLILTETGRFKFNETPNAKERLSKVVKKTILKRNKTQLNFHDGSNIIATGKIKVGDSVYLDLSSKIKRHISFEKGKDCIIISGKYIGCEGKIGKIEQNKVKVNLKSSSPILERRSVIAI